MKASCRVTVICAAAVLATGCAFAQANPALIAQLDAASAKFKSAQADVQYDNYTRVVRDHALQSGSIYVERTGGSVSMGARFFDIGSDGKPSNIPSRVINFDGGTFQIYSPGTNQDDVFKAGANQAKYESFLTLGFGGSGSDLQKAWVIQDQGPETIDGIKTEKLDLVSKDSNVKSTFTHVTIWVDPSRAVSLKQIFFAPNGDARTATYSNIKLNARVDKKPYAIKSGAQKIAH